MEVQLTMPVAIAQKYLSGTHSKEFNDFMEKNQLSVTNVKETDSPAKRTEGESPDKPAAKKQNCGVSPDKIVDGATITAALLFKAKVSSISKQNVEVQIRDGGMKCLVNMGAGETTVLKGTQLIGFGKGAFKMTPDAEAPIPDQCLEFKLKDEMTNVLIGGSFRKLGSVIQDQRQKAPSAQACYHKLVVNENDPAKFVLTQTHRIYYVPSPAADSDPIKDGNIGAKVPKASSWNTDVSEITWMVRWVTKGLQSQLPKVCLTKDVTLAPGAVLIF